MEKQEQEEQEEKPSWDPVESFVADGEASGRGPVMEFVQGASETSQETGVKGTEEFLQESCCVSLKETFETCEHACGLEAGSGCAHLEVHVRLGRVHEDQP